MKALASLSTLAILLFAFANIGNAQTVIHAGKLINGRDGKLHALDAHDGYQSW